MSDASLTALPAAAASASPPAPAGLSLWSKGGFSFKDLLDIVNPLQHLPVIGSIYRYVTGDEPSGGATIVGDALYGGPIGLGVGVVGTMLTDSQGRDIGERILAAIFSPSETSPAQPKPLMAAVPAAPQSAPPGSAAQVQTETQFVRNLYRSPPPAATPQQAFLAQNAQLQRRFAGTHVQTTRMVPLELTSNLLATARPQPAYASAAATPAAALSATAPLNGAVAPGSIAQKMRDALDKYEQMKKQQIQEDGAPQPAPSPVDLSF